MTPFWIQTRKNLLRKHRLDSRQYNAAIQSLKLPDFVSFTALMDPRNAISPTDRIALHSLASFEANGCRVLAPTANLMSALANTDANVPLGNIAPPYPAVLICLPCPIKHLTGDQESKHVSAVLVAWRPQTDAERPTDKLADGIYYLRPSMTAPGGMFLPPDVVRQKMDPLRTHELASAKELIFLPPKVAKRFMASDYVATFVLFDKLGRAIDFQDIKWDVGQNSVLAQDFYQTWMEETERIGFRVDPWRQSPEFAAWQAIFRLVANLFCYMSSPHSSITRQKSKWTSAEKADNAARRAEIMASAIASCPADEFIVGQNIILATRDHTGTHHPGRESTSPCTHWRRGHWHGYWTGPRDQAKLVYKLIEPVLVVGQGLPIGGSIIRIDK